MNNTIRYSGDSGDLLGVCVSYFKSTSFLAMSKSFTLTYEAYIIKTRYDLLLVLRNSVRSKRHFDSMWGHEHITFTQNKNYKDITVSNQMLTLIFFLKDEDAMMEYSEYMNVLGASVHILIEELGIKDTYPECFV